MTVLVVDWLGRGGIAQATDSWRSELRRAGREVVVVTRGDRELVDGDATAVTAGAEGNALLAHRAVARAAVAAIHERRPSTVVVQNYVVPPIERAVHRAARAVGAATVVVVHDHRLHSPLAGTRAGLAGLLRHADAVVAHSEFVAADVRRFSGRSDVVVAPLPLPVGLLDGGAGPSPLPAPAPGERAAVHFGILKRGYKGTDLVADLVRARPPGWTFALLGVGAPSVPPARTVARFLTTGELFAAVAQADVAVLPYRLATQSAAVVLSQALGTVPLTTRTGGIPEQVEDGRTGLLLDRDAPVPAWLAALARLEDAKEREAMAARAREAARDGHRRSIEAVLRLTA